MEKHRPLMIAIAYVSVVLIWSTTPLMIKWSGEGVGFMFGITGRMLIGAALCLLLSFAWYRRLPLHKKALQVYAVAGLAIFGAMMAVYWGAQYISSGLISVVFGLTPILTSILAARFLHEQSLTGFKVAGAMIGVSGLALIFAEQLNFGGQAFMGVFAVLVSVTLHAISSVGIKRINAQLPALIVTCGGLLVSLPFFLLVFFMLPGSMPDQFPSRAIGAIIYLGVMGSVVGFVSYYFLLQNLTASTVALITLITPVTALWLGYVFNHEVISISTWLGTGCVIMGLASHQWGGMLSRYLWQKKKHFYGS